MTYRELAIAFFLFLIVCDLIVSRHPEATERIVRTVFRERER